MPPLLLYWLALVILLAMWPKATAPTAPFHLRKTCYVWPKYWEIGKTVAVENQICMVTQYVYHLKRLTLLDDNTPSPADYVTFLNMGTKPSALFISGLPALLLGPGDLALCYYGDRLVAWEANDHLRRCFWTSHVKDEQTPAPKKATWHVVPRRFRQECRFRG